MSTSPRTAVRLRTAALTVAATAAVVLGLPATAAQARWDGSAPVGTSATATGRLGIDTGVVDDGVWTRDGSTFDPRSGTVAPGSTVRYTATQLPVTALGNNLVATFSLDDDAVAAAVPDAAEGHVTITVASDPQPVRGATSGTGARTVTLTLTVAVAADLPGGPYTLDLHALPVTLSNGRGWADTVTLDAGSLTTSTPAPGGLVTLHFNALSTDLDRKIGFHLSGVGPGTRIHWNEYVPGTGTEIVTDAVNGLNEFQYADRSRTSAWVRIEGTFAGFGSPDQTVAQIGALTNVEGWDDRVGSTSARYAFLDARNLAHVSTLPDGLRDTSYAFARAGTAQPLGSPYIDDKGWDVSNVTTTAHMFEGATSYTEVGLSWATANVRDMSFMFAGATSYTGGIRLDLSSVTTTEGMFRGATSYTGTVYGDTVGDWDVSSVEDMSAMFEGATAFDGDVGRWDTGSVTRMDAMFRGASSMRRDLSGWDVAAVTPQPPTDFRLGAHPDLVEPRWDVTAAAAEPSAVEPGADEPSATGPTPATPVPTTPPARDEGPES